MEYRAKVVRSDCWLGSEQLVISELWYSFKEVVQSICSPESQWVG